MKVNSLKAFSLLLFVLAMSVQMQAQQKFKGAIVGGINLSQIDGDELAGFNKIGLTGGFKLNYPVATKTDLSVEMLYSGRGSNSVLGFGGNGSVNVALQYLEAPILVRFKDWYIEDSDYHKASAHAGLSVGYLFDNIEVY